MDVKEYNQPKTGDYSAFRVEIWHEGKLKIIYVGKLTHTEIAISIANKCVKDENEALEKLRRYCRSEAIKLFEKNVSDKTLKQEKYFSPCW
jgi:hypothetical protein